MHNEHPRLSLPPLNLCTSQTLWYPKLGLRCLRRSHTYRGKLYQSQFHEPNQIEA
jgi:hypothetical protein